MSDTAKKAKLGNFFVEIFCHLPTRVFDLSFKNSIEEDELDENNLMYILKMNSAYINTLEKNIIVQPISLPMICKPNVWSDTEFGGFISNSIIKNIIITGSHQHGHKIEDKEKLYITINYLNSIKFKINSDLINYLESKDGSIILNHYLKSLKTKSEKLQANLTLGVARTFHKLNMPFYINTNAD